MNIKILSIGVIKKVDSVLLRKKPEGSPPYKETWYLFGGTVDEHNPSPQEALKQKVKEQTGIDIEIKETLSWDTEIKEDHDGETKLFIYLDSLCEYTGGELEIRDNKIQKLEWVPIEKLSEYDLVPPSVKLFKKIGWL